MAKKISAYDAAKIIYGTDKEKIAEVGKAYPLFARTVSMENSALLLDILAAISNMPAKTIEDGLSGLDSNDDVKEEKTEEKVKEEDAEDDFGNDENGGDDDYSSMTNKRLYEICCERGISSRCKKRSKDELIKVLKQHDAELKNGGGNDDDTEPEEKEETGNKYKGKKAKELYMMCKERGIKAEPKKTASVYAELLIKADEEEAKKNDDDDDWDDDDWEI